MQPRLSDLISAVDVSVRNTFGFTQGESKRDSLRKNNAALVRAAGVSHIALLVGDLARAVADAGVPADADAASPAPATVAFALGSLAFTAEQFRALFPLPPAAGGAVGGGGGGAAERQLNAAAVAGAHDALTFLEFRESTSAAGGGGGAGGGAGRRRGADAAWGFHERLVWGTSARARSARG
jgi:hypothetical protein